jgi:hypothetical protein
MYSIDPVNDSHQSMMQDFLSSVLTLSLGLLCPWVAVITAVTPHLAGGDFPTPPRGAREKPWTGCSIWATNAKYNICANPSHTS